MAGGDWVTITAAELDRLRRIEEVAGGLMTMLNDPVAVARHMLNLTLQTAQANSDLMTFA